MSPAGRIAIGTYAKEEWWDWRWYDLSSKGATFPECGRKFKAYINEAGREAKELAKIIGCDLAPALMDKFEELERGHAAKGLLPGIQAAALQSNAHELVGINAISSARVAGDADAAAAMQAALIDQSASASRAASAAEAAAKSQCGCGSQK